MAVDAAEIELILKSLKRWAGWERIPDDIMQKLASGAEVIEV